MAIASMRRAQDIPLTPPRYTSSPALRGSGAAVGDTLFAGDSPLPSPPSITRPTPAHRSLAHATSGASDKDLNEGDGDHRPLESAEGDERASSRHRQSSPTPAPSDWRTRRADTRDRPASPHRLADNKQAMSLAESMGASPPPSKSVHSTAFGSAPDRPRLESKFGIEPLRPSTRPKLGPHGRAFSHNTSRATSEEQQDMPRLASSSSRPASSNARSVAFSNPSEARVPKVAPRSSDEGQDVASRPGSSLATRSREASRDYKIADVALASGARVSRKRVALDGNEPLPVSRAQEERAASAAEVRQYRKEEEAEDAFKGKSSAGSDSGPSSSSPHQQDATSGNSSKGTHSGSSREDKPFAYTTPALAAGARSMRSSHTATAVRSAGRTLRRLGPGEARPAHARAVRVMVPQGAAESDAEEEEEAPGVAVGVDANAAAYSTATREDGVAKPASPPDVRPAVVTGQEELARRSVSPEHVLEVNPPLQSTAHYMEGLSLRPKRPGSPDARYERRHGAETSNATQHRDLQENGERPDNAVAGQRNTTTRPVVQREIKAVSPPPMPLGAEDDEEEDEEHGGQRKANGQDVPPPSRNEAFPYARRSLGLLGSRAGLLEREEIKPTSAEEKENEAVPPRAAAAAAAYKKSLQSVLNAKVPIPSASNGAHVSSMAQRPAAAMERQPLSSHPRATNGSSAPTAPEPRRPVAATAPQTPAAPLHHPPVNAAPPASRAMPPSPVSVPPENYDFARLEPAIEAEKNRLLDLNGWDPWVQAVFEEAQRQRYNGSSFGENLVGKPLPTRKETKFRGCRYMKVSKAGDGGFSSVFQVLGPTMIPGANGLEPVPAELQGWFALKQVTLKGLEQSSRDGLVQEAELLDDLSQLEHSERYLVRYFGHKQNGETLKMLMELGESDFNRHLVAHHPLPRPALSEYYKQMLASVHFVHSAGLLHTDLKPANFLMIQGRIKIIDFGIAEKIPIGTLHIRRDNIVGTPNYMAPETIQQKGAEQEGVVAYKTGKPADVWSLGCILYQMVYGKTPFADFSGPAKLKAITNRNHVIAFPTKRHPDCDGSGPSSVEEVDEMLMDCLKSTLIYSAEKRAKIPTLLDHPFVRDDVTIERRKLRKIVLRIQAYMQQGGLTDDNVEEMADRLMTNLQLESFRPFCEN